MDSDNLGWCARQPAEHAVPGGAQGRRVRQRHARPAGPGGGPPIGARSTSTSSTSMRASRTMSARRYRELIPRGEQRHERSRPEGPRRGYRAGTHRNERSRPEGPRRGPRAGTHRNERCRPEGPRRGPRAGTHRNAGSRPRGPATMGIREGRVEGERTVLERQLRRRFGPPLRRCCGKAARSVRRPTWRPGPSDCSTRERQRRCSLPTPDEPRVARTCHPNDAHW